MRFRASFFALHILAAAATTLAPARRERQAPMDAPRIRAIFSDLDGTIVHFPKWFREYGIDLTDRRPEANRAEVLRKSDGERRGCHLLPESTMGDGIVSDRTVAAFRHSAVIELPTGRYRTWRNPHIP